MALLRRPPFYAAGAGFTAAIVAVAVAWEWSGWLTLLVAGGVGVFYVVTILVPWLIREQILDTTDHLRPGTEAIVLESAVRIVTWNVELRPLNRALVLAGDEEEGELGALTTRGSKTIRPSEPQLSAR